MKQMHKVILSRGVYVIRLGVTIDGEDEYIYKLGYTHELARRVTEFLDTLEPLSIEVVAFQCVDSDAEAKRVEQNYHRTLRQVKGNRIPSASVKGICKNGSDRMGISEWYFNNPLDNLPKHDLVEIEGGPFTLLDGFDVKELIDECFKDLPKIEMKIL